MKIRIYYEDTDAGGVVYHSNYLKFCERARSEIFFRTQAQIFDAQNGHFLLTKANCSFLKSARLGDILFIKSTLLELKNASVKIKQEIFKEPKNSSFEMEFNENLSDMIFEADFTLAFVKNNKPSKISEDLKRLFVSLF